MIEALSTVLEETMNRKEAQFHSVAEELAYADAYLYIISQRFGAKFSCTKQIDERLMSLQVPRLIIQPIVENAAQQTALLLWLRLLTITLLFRAVSCPLSTLIQATR